MTEQYKLSHRVAAIQIILCALWGFGQVAVKIGNTGISPLFQAGLRSTGAMLLILAWIAVRGIRIDWRDNTLGLGLGIGLLFALEFICLYIGLGLTGAGRATILLYTAPFFVAVGAHWLVPNDRLNRYRVLGLVLAFIGVLLALGDRAGAASREALIGDLLCLIAAFFWAMTTIMVKATRLRSTQPEKVLLYQLVVSAVVLLAGSALVGESGIHTPSAQIWAALAYQTVVIASATYLIWFFLVSRYRASTLSTFTFLTPVFGVICAWLLLGEPISAAIVLALALVASGIVLVNRS